MSEFKISGLTGMEQLGRLLAKQLHVGDVVLLYGTLGAGKTTLARSIVLSLAPQECDVASPTFTLMQPYEILLEEKPATCWHIDLYRLDDPHDIEELGLDELQPNNLTLVEWPERFGNALPRDHIACHLRLAPDDGDRMVSLTFAGHNASRASQVLHEFTQAF